MDESGSVICDSRRSKHRQAEAVRVGQHALRPTHVSSESVDKGVCNKSTAFTRQILENPGFEEESIQLPIYLPLVDVAGKIIALVLGGEACQVLGKLSPRIHRATNKIHQSSTSDEPAQHANLSSPRFRGILSAWTTQCNKMR